MGITLTTTKKATGKVKVLVYGGAGLGKTVLCSTAPNPIIISAEAGLLSISDHDIPVIEVNTVEDVMEAYSWLTENENAKKYETICLDSITEIAEVLLTQYKREEKDPRKAYGRLNDDMAHLIRSFRDIKGKNVYFTAKSIKKEDESSGISLTRPAMPGATLTNNLAYWFDEVLCLRIGKTESGKEFRYLQTAPELLFDAKDRSGCLSKMEKPDLQHIFDKISKGKMKVEEEVKENESVMKEEKAEEKDKASDKDEKKNVLGRKASEEKKEPEKKGGLTLGVKPEVSKTEAKTV